MGELGLRVVVVDDDETFLKSTIELLQEHGLECEGTCDPRECVALAAAGSVDVLVCDLVMRGELQIDLLREIADLPNPPATILVTAFPTLESAIEALDLGVAGYLVKPFEAEALFRKIDEAGRRRSLRQVLERARESLLDASGGLDNVFRLVESILAKGAEGTAPGPPPAAAGAEPRRPPMPRLEALTPRERELVGELLLGYRVSTIARRLQISPHTVRRHLKNIFLKLEVGSQAELVERLKPWSDPQ